MAMIESQNGQSDPTQPIYTKDSLPAGPFAEYAKVRTTRAIKVTGTFHCLTSEGNIASCKDGWLAVDSRGYPYPINSAEFEVTYTLADANGSEA